MKVTVKELLDTDGAFESLLGRDAGVMLHIGVLDAQESIASVVGPLKKKNEVFSKASDEITKKFSEKDADGNPVVTTDPVTRLQSVKISDIPKFNAAREPHIAEWDKFLDGEVTITPSLSIPRELLPDPINGQLLKRIRPFFRGEKDLVKAPVKKAAKNG